MTDVASLGLQVDSSDVTTATTALDKLTVSASRSEGQVRSIQAAADRAGVSFDTMAKRVDDASSSTDKSATSSTKATTATTTHATALGKTGTAADTSGKTLGKLSEILAVLEARELKLASNMGIFGQLLSVIGPTGLAAAAGVGAIVVAIDQLVSSANRMGDLAQQLQNLSTVTGVSTTSLQSLQSAAVAFGASSEETGRYITGFTRQLDQLRQGTGTLYTQLLKIDPALLAQISVAKSTTDAINLLAQAYVKAGASQNALANAAAGGRNGAQFGLLLGDIASKGGVDGITASVNQLDQLTNDQIKTWAKLKAQIDDASTNAKNNIASIYTGSVLEAEKSFYDKFLDLSREMKQFSLSSDYQKFIDSLTKDVGPGKTTIFGYLSSLPGKGVSAISSRVASVNASNAPYPAGSDPMSAGGSYMSPGGLPVPASPAVQASIAAAQISFLGSAATASEKYDAAVKKLNADVAANATLTGLQGRAMAALGLDRAVSVQSSYVTALGEFATTQDKATLASLNFQKVMLTNSRLTDTQRLAVVALTAANDEWARASNQAQLGVFDLGAATKAAGDQFKAQQAPGGLLDKATPEQLASAFQAATNKVQALGEAARVAGAKLPQLQQLINDSGNLSKQLDTTGVSSLNSLNSSLLDYQTGVKSAGDATKDFEQQFIRSLLSMMNQMLIIQPIALALKNLLGGISGVGFLGIGSVGSTGGGALATTSQGVGGIGGLYHTGGIVGSEPTATRYIHPAYFDQAPRFHSGGIAGDEVPIITKRGEGVFTPGQMAAMGGGGKGGDTHITYQIDASGADSGTVKRIEAVLAKHASVIGQQAKAMESAQRYQATGVN